MLFLIIFNHLIDFMKRLISIPRISMVLILYTLLNKKLIEYTMLLIKRLFLHILIIICKSWV